MEGINPHSLHDVNPSQCEDELISIKSFFKKADTDVEIVKEIWQTIYSEDMFFSFKKGMEFLCEASKLLYQPISKNKYISKQEEIFDIAKMCSIQKNHILVICALAVLYKNKNIIKLLKFKLVYGSYEAYNAMSDITALQMTALTSYMINQAECSIKKVKFFSFDNPLKYLFNILVDCHFHVQGVEGIENSNKMVSFQMQVPPKAFFQACNEEQYKSIVASIEDTK